MGGATTQTCTRTYIHAHENAQMHAQTHTHTQGRRISGAVEWGLRGNTLREIGIEGRRKRRLGAVVWGILTGKKETRDPLSSGQFTSGFRFWFHIHEIMANLSSNYGRCSDVVFLVWVLVVEKEEEGHLILSLVITICRRVF